MPAVHAALLDDLVFPTQIEARRTRYRQDGSKLLKVYLDPKGAHPPPRVASLFACTCTRGALGTTALGMY